jgi:hypothetical protein
MKMYDENADNQNQDRGQGQQAPLKPIRPTPPPARLIKEGEQPKKDED